MHLLLFIALLAPPTPTVHQRQQYHERTVKVRTQAWRMFIDECQHRQAKNLYRHPSWCKVVK